MSLLPACRPWRNCKLKLISNAFNYTNEHTATDDLDGKLRCKVIERAVESGVYLHTGPVSFLKVPTLMYH